jgi:ABC-2 type transport system ATP-binding protein
MPAPPRGAAEALRPYLQQIGRNNDATSRGDGGGRDDPGGAVTGGTGIVLEARDVHKAYGRHQVLNGVGLEVRAGQLVAVVGENGAGKSTLLRILAGDMAADRGQVRVTGTLGYCPQEPVVNGNLTVGQHLRYFAAARRLASLKRADELLALLGFGAFKDQVVGALSGGTRQKLNLALALLHDPDVLLLDEPYQGFDWETYLRFWDVVGDLRARGKAIVIITHLVFDQDRFDLLASLAEGRLTRHDPPAEDPDDRH